MLNLYRLRPLNPLLSLMAFGWYMVGQPVLAQIPVLVEAEAVYPAYILGAGDQIQITVFGYEEFTGTKVVLPNGLIDIPLLGSVPAAGRTPDQLAYQLTQQLDSYLVDPVVTVSLNSLRPVVVNVSGEVHRPGPIELSSLTNVVANNPNSTAPGEVLTQVPTVSSALMESGGVTRNADIRQVVLRRTLPGGESTLITLNLWDALWSEAPPEDVVLQAGDSIFVPPLPEGDMLDQRLLARSTFSPQTVQVRVIGEVRIPGQIEISPESTISSAVAIAGGPTEDAEMDDVEIIRLNRDGSITAQEIDLSDLDDSYQVQEGDVVYVPERGSSSFLRVLGQVISPVGGIISIVERLLN